MTTSDNISAIEAVEKAVEGGYWASSVHDCRPPHSRRDHPRRHSRVITLPEKFLTEQEALEAGAVAIASGWAGSTIIHRESATHSALFELGRHRVTELVRALPSILAEARKAEALTREIAELREAGEALAAQARSYQRGFSGTLPLGQALNNWDKASTSARTLLNGGPDAGN